MEIQPRTEKSAAFTLHLDRHEMMALEVGLARLSSRDDKIVWGEDCDIWSSYRLWRQVREALGFA